MSETKERYNVVDTFTGEVVDTTKGLYPEPLNEDGYRFPHHKAGSRLFDEVQFPEDMTPAEIGRMTILSKLMIAQSNMLGYRKSGQIRAYTEEEIIRLSRLKIRQGKTFINRMLHFRLLHRLVTTSEIQFYVNPAYFMASGRRLTISLYHIFQQDLDPIIPLWVKREFLSMCKDKAEVYNADVVKEAEDILKGDS